MAATRLSVSPYFSPWVEYLLAWADYYRLPVTITSQTRSAADQARICRENPGVPCAPPGSSPHQYGFAIDMFSGVNSRSKEHQQLRAIADWIGFAPAIRDDPVHFEHPQWRAARGNYIGR